MYNFGELKDNVATIAQRTTTAYKNNIGIWLNLGQETLFNAYDYYFELKGVHNFTTVDGTALYYLPSDCVKIMRFYDITNNKHLNVRDEYEYYDANIANIADAIEASPNDVYVKEVVGVNRQVATTGDTVQIKSSSASDTAEINRVEGYIDSDLTIVGGEDITVTGTTFVSGTTTFYKIIKYSKDSDSTGYMTLADSSSNTLATLSATDRVSRYMTVRLGLIPDDSTTSMQVLFKRRYRKMVNDYDYPFIESDDFLIFFASSLALRQQKDNSDVAADFKQRAAEAFNLILFQQNSKMGPDFQQKLITAFAQAHRS